MAIKERGKRRDPVAEGTRERGDRREAHNYPHGADRRERDGPPYRHYGRIRAVG
jgi:hypothetical protein